MAEENTTASTPTQTDAPTASTSDTSTTTTQSAETGQSTEGDEGEGTILTPNPADTEADHTADGTGDQSTEQKGEEEGDKPAENAELFGVPEGTYELEGLPEGTVVDTKALEAIEPVAKELGLSNKGLSKIAGVYAEKVLPQVIESFQSDLQNSITETHRQWATEATELVKTDPVFGGKPLKEVQQVAAKALDRFGGEDLRKFLTDSGLGNYPGLVKFAYQAGSAISEDTSFERGSNVPKAKTQVERFYGPQS